MKLRPYQTKLIDLIRDEFKSGKTKVIGWLATGGGKSAITMELIKNLLNNNKKVVFVVKRRQLVIDTHRKFLKAGIMSGLIMGKEKGFNPSLSVQICSIDTVRRDKPEYQFMYDFDFVLTDEMQDSTSPTYRAFYERFNNANHIGVTATPFLNGGKAQDFWQSCVKSIEVHELIEQGYLVPLLTYWPSAYDFSEVKVTAGDYNNKQLGKVMSDSKIVGDIVENYKKIADGKKAFCFAVNKEHGAIIEDAFNEAGIPAKMIDESTKQRFRDQYITELRTGKIKVLVNINTLSTGVDVPEVEVGIMARPTKSEILWVQQLGRIARPCRICGRCKTQYDNSPQCPKCGYDKPDYIKPHGIIIDHGNNTRNLMPIDHIRKAVLEQPERTKVKKDPTGIEPEIKIKSCDNCKFTYSEHLPECPACGHANQNKKRTIKTVDGELVMYSHFEHIRSDMLDLKERGIVYGWRPTAYLFKLYDKYGDSVYKYKELEFPAWVKKYAEKDKKK